MTAAVAGRPGRAAGRPGSAVAPAPRAGRRVARGGPALVALLGLGFAACEPRNNRTLLVANVDTDLAAGQIDEIAIDVKSAGASTTESFPLGRPPVQLGIRPRGAPGFEIEVTARGLLRGQPVVSQIAAGVRFEAGQARQFMLFLGRSCAGKACPADQTCAGAGECKARREIARLVPYPGDPGGAGGDAAAAAGADGPRPGDGAGGAGGAAPDAGAPDARPRDARPVSGSWSVVSSPDVPSSATLAAVWPIAADDVWVVGSVSLRGVAYHYDGRAWTAATLPASAMTTPLTGVWASSPGEVWATGYGGTILRRTGGTWTAVPSGTNVTLTSIWGAGPAEIWVVGNGGTALRWNGSSFAPSATGAGVNLLAVTGVRSDEVYAVGTGGAVFRGSGARWERQNHGLTQASLFGVWASSANDVWAVGTNVSLHFDGAVWTLHRGSPDNGNGVWGSAADDVWAVGSVESTNGPITRWDGVRWSTLPAPTVPGVSRLSLQAVRGLAATDVWAVGVGGTILRLR